MTNADWRSLIEAYLDGRLSAEAFARRFLEAWRSARDRHEPTPRAIDALSYAAESAEAEIDAAREEGAFNDDDLRNTAQRALSELRDPAPAATSRFERFRASDDMRRFRVHASGCAGLGCVFALVWVGLCVLQIFAVSDQIQSTLDWPAAPATFVGLFLAFVPILGNVIAFFGAVDVWGWPIWIAAIVFFAAPAATLISGWPRWRRPRQ